MMAEVRDQKTEVFEFGFRNAECGIIGWWNGNRGESGTKSSFLPNALSF
jgi:hypothetical protein